ncbi:MAG: hypothetical protein ABSA53_28385, partial [Streptosporangiaceae bacterium]
PPGPLTEHGRGLLIVTALSHQWGTHPAPNGGKYTWATLRTPAGDTPATRNTATPADQGPQGTP